MSGTFGMEWVHLSVCMCVCAGAVGWNEHRTREGTSYYHNPSTGVSQWERPAEFEGQSTELNRDEIQVRCYMISNSELSSN
jgi:hypothetical protein